MDYKIITFDVFDTLVVRDCTSFKNVWRLVEKEADFVLKKKTSFFYKRFNSERALYAQGNLTPSISEIYDMLDYSDDVKKYLLNLEHKIEYNNCNPNYFVKDLFDSYKKQGKKIYAVSDMYFSSEFIIKILNKCGYNVDGIVVSNEERKRKIDGELYKCLEAKYGIKLDNALHYGDSVSSDVKGAQIAGLTSKKVDRMGSNTSYLKKGYGKDVASELLHGYINNSLPFQKNRAAQIGFETLGPVILGFCQWIHRRKQELKIKNILFCSRDLYQTYKWYIRLFPEEKCNVKYFYVSLKCLSIPYKVSKDIENSTNAEIEQYNYLRNYIKQITDDNEFILADSGFGGHTQSMLDCVLGDDYIIHGLYIRMSQKFLKRARINNNAEAYLFRKFSSPKTRISGGFFESLIQATHSRTISYKVSDDDSVVPVFAKAKEYNPVIDDIHHGIDSFIDGWIKRGYLKYKINEKYINHAFFNLTFYPLPKDVELLSDLQGGNSIPVKMVEELPDNSVCKPFKFLKGLKSTYWKGGYLAKTTKKYKLISGLYVLIDSIYLFIRGY